MWRRAIPVRVGAYSFTIFGVEFLDKNDVIDPRSPTAQKLAAKVNIALENQTGWDRLKGMFGTDDLRTISPELDNTLSAGVAGATVGFLLGGIPAFKIAYNEFIDRNKASKFESHFDAKSKLQFSVTKNMCVAGFKVGWRLGLFSAAYTFFTTAVSTYRNKSSIIEYTCGGALAGAAYKLPMGPKGMVAGGAAGAVLGTGAGAITLAIMMLTGTTTEELRYWRQGWKEASTREIMSIENPVRAKAIGPLGMAHELELARKAAQEPSEVEK